MLVTLSYGLLDAVTGEVSYVNTEHSPPLSQRTDQDALKLLTRTGMVLGASRTLRLSNARRG